MRKLKVGENSRLRELTPANIGKVLGVSGATVYPTSVDNTPGPWAVKEAQMLL